MVLLILALVWAVVLIPHHLRNRAHNRPGDSVLAFRRQLAVLERTSPVQGAAARRVRAGALRASVARKRRRDLLCALLAGMAGSLVLGFLPGLAVLHVVHVGLDVLCAVYVSLLVRRRTGATRMAPVIPLPTEAPLPDGALLLQRSGT